MEARGDGTYRMAGGATFAPTGGIARVFADAAAEGLSPSAHRELMRFRRNVAAFGSIGEYELAKARVDLTEAEMEFDAAVSDEDRTAALDRLDDAEHRMRRWGA